MIIFFRFYLFILAELNPYPWGFDVNDHIKAVDYGDCWLDVWDPKTIKDSITDHARQIIKNDTKMLTFGGI